MRYWCMANQWRRIRQVWGTVLVPLQQLLLEFGQLLGLKSWIKRNWATAKNYINNNYVEHAP